MAADHRDGPASIDDPSTDINDVFAFMNPNDAEEVILIMTVHPLADDTSRFSNAATYNFNITNVPVAAAVLGPDEESYTISCTYDGVDDSVTCNDAEDGEDVTVDFNAGGATPAGEENTAGTFRVWAGLRDDPFFFDLAAFQATADGDPDTDGWFDDTPPTPANFFAGLNTLSIVVGIDKDVIDGGGADASEFPVLRVWASSDSVTE
jgi:hypothetical protein